MVGFYGGAPLEYAGINEQGSDAVSSGTGAGAAFSEGLALNPFGRINRQIARTASETGIFSADPMMGFPLQPEQPLDPETANRDFGIPGVLSFDQPVTPTVARDLFEAKRAKIERDDTIARSESGIVAGAARLSAALGASLLDPINVAAGFIPIIGPAREAALIAQASGAIGRAGVRAGIGAGAGAVGMAALQPLEFALSAQEREDYTMADALRSIALGTVLGGGLHAGVGGAIDRATGRYRNPIAQAIEDAGPDARETALRGALAQTIEGRPVEVAPVFQAVEQIRARRVQANTPEDLLARRPDDIIDFLNKQGGLIDEGGELRAMDLHKPMKGKFGILARRGGVSLDYAREAAEEAGFLPQGSTVNDLLNALRDTTQGRPVFRPEEGAVFNEVQRTRLLREQEATRDPFDPNDMFGDLDEPALRGAIDDVFDSMRQDFDVEPQARVEADRAMSRPSDTLQTIRQEIADLERMTAPPETPATVREASGGEQTATRPEGAPAARAAPSEADLAVELAEARASAVERAALCITRGG